MPDSLPPNGAGPHGTNGAPPPPPAAYYDPAADEIDLHTLFQTLQRQWWVIAVTAVGILLVVAAYTLLQEPEFEASTVVLVETQQGANRWTQGGMEELLSFRVGNRSLNNEVAILQQSIPLAERVAARLFDQYNGGPLTAANEDGWVPNSAYVARVMLNGQRVRFAPVSQDTDLITITAKSTDPQEAAAVANLYAEEYARRSQEASRASIAGSRRFLEEQEEQQRRMLDDVESQVQEFVAREGAVALDTEAQQTVSQLSQLDSQLEGTRVDLEIERVTLREREAELERVQPGLARRIASGIDSEMQAVTQQIAELEVEAQPYYAENPGIRGNEESIPELAAITRRTRQLRERLNTLTDQYIEEVMAVGGVDQTGATGVGYATQLQRDIIQQRIRIQGLEARAEALRRQVAGQEQRMRDIPRQSMQLAQLQRQRQSISDTYLFLVNKLQEARVAEQSQIGYVQVIRNADTPGSPVRPRTRLNLMVGLLLGLMGGVGLALLRNALDRKIREPEDLRDHEFTVLGTVPDLGALIEKNFGGKERVMLASGEVDATIAAALHPLSPLAEAMRQTRTNIRFSLPDRKVQIILVTSTGPKEGKTTTAVNLAVSMAQAGKRTLLVDGDLRRPMIHSRLGTKRDRGLSDLLFKDGPVKWVDDSPVDWEQFRYRLDAQWDGFETTVDDLYVVTAGKRVPNPAELLGSNRMRELLGEMRESFDVVIVDSPPVLAVADPTILASMCDACVMVAVAGRSDHRALDRVREQLALSSTPLLGVVLNRYQRTGRGYGYGYGYGYAYGHGYGYGATDKFISSGDGVGTGAPTVSSP